MTTNRKKIAKKLNFEGWMAGRAHYLSIGGVFECRFGWARTKGGELQIRNHGTEKWQTLLIPGNWEITDSVRRDVLAKG